MKNRKLLLTLLALVVLIAGVVLLKQNNISKDASIAHNGTDPKTEKPAKKSQQVKPTQSKPGLKVSNDVKPMTIKPANSAQKAATKPAFNKAEWKAEEIKKLKAEIQQTTDPAYKAKLQKRLNSLQ